MALLGSSVDPRLFLQDYSGFTRAAEIQAQGIQNLGAAIGQGIKDFGEARQERKKLDAGIKANRKSIESALKLGESLGIDVSSLNPILEQMDDPNVTPMEAAALGQAGAQRITDTLNLGIGLQDRAAKLEQSRAENLYKQGMLEASQMRAGASVLSAQQGAAPKYEQKKTTVNVDGSPVEVDVLMDQYGNSAEIGTKKPIKDIQKFVTGEEGWEGEAMPTPTSQVMPSDGSFKFSYDTRDKLPASSPTNRQISLDFNAAPSKNAKGIEIIIPNNATEEERQIAQEYVAKTQQYFAERGVNVPARGVRTAKENGRGTPNRFHTEPFFVGDAASRAVMEKDPDGYAQVLASTLGRIPGAMFIPPHKSNDPGAADGKFNERDFAKGSIIPALERLSKQRSAQANPAGIDNALSMGGDMTQQAMGTPAQQAEIARMIQEGQGVATASTESGSPVPSQPAPTPRPLARGVYVDQKQGQQKQAKIITGEEAKALNLDPLGTYEASYQDGQLTGVQTLKAAPSVGDVIAMEKRQEEQAMQQQAKVAVAEKSNRMVNLMNELKSHEGFNRLFGATAIPTWIPGSSGADAAALLKQIDALGFMEAIKDMKGMGALSNAEGEKASAAFVGITPDMSEKAAKKKIDEVIGYIQKGQSRIQTGNLIETKENKGPSIGGANSYFNQFNQPPAR
jgi:hypothetical protein